MEREPRRPRPDNQWWVPLLDFAVHVVVGTLIFIIIGAPAVVLNLVLHELTNLAIDRFVFVGLQIAEYTLFAVDLVLYLVFLIRKTRATLREM